MKITDFIEEIKKNNIDLQEILEIRTYIPIVEKRAILETVLDGCFTVEDGVLVCNYILKKMAFELAMIKYHTNLEIDILSEDDYDEIQKSGVNIHWGYLSDYQECQLLFDGMERELRAKYSIKSSIAKLTDRLSDNIDGLVNLVAEKVKDIDIGSFGLEGTEFDQFKDLLNKYGK